MVVDGSDHGHTAIIDMKLKPKVCHMTAVLYTDGNQECDRIRMLLSKLHGEFLEYQLGKDFSDIQFAAEFGDNAEYPQVAINCEHIGGLKETLHYLKEKHLI